MAQVAEEERSAEAEINMLEERAYHQFGMSADKARSWAEGTYNSYQSDPGEGYQGA